MRWVSLKLEEEEENRPSPSGPDLSRRYDYPSSSSGQAVLTIRDGIILLATASQQYRAITRSRTDML
jgi:hypothetical protein